MSYLTLDTKEDLKEFLDNVERVLRDGINNKNDLEYFMRFDDWYFRGKGEDSMRYLRNHKDANTKGSYLYSRCRDDFHYFQGFGREELDKYINIIEFSENSYNYYTDENKKYNFMKEFISTKVKFLDESVYEFGGKFKYIEHFKNFSEEQQHEILKYHLKVKNKKTSFSTFLNFGILNEKNLTELKLTDKQLVNLIFGQFNALIKKNIRIAEITNLKVLRKIKPLITEGVILEIVSKFVKDAEKKRYLDEDTIEVILSMFLHYLDLSISDFSDAQLLLLLNFDKEIEV